MATKGPSIAAPEIGRLLAWYDGARRDLPWRASPGGTMDPYRVWLSEIMLQQTTVATVIPYFLRFVQRWPSLADLAAAESDDVLAAWAGLGYYARARRLHACARVVVAEHGGLFPQDLAALRALPGIGAYTAAAIAAIAFGVAVVPVDGNVERVLARVHAVEVPLPAAKALLRAHAATIAPGRRAGDVAQALMDLGATVCTPRAPSCPRCPWAGMCRARALGIADRLPVAAAKAARPERHGVAFWLVRDDGRVLLRRRPPEGLLGGMLEVPSTPWRARPWGAAEAKVHAPGSAVWRPVPGLVVHVFTHFRLTLTVWRAVAPRGPGARGTWHAPDRLADLALPSVMRKVAAHAQLPGHTT